jgi:hypothetical protein
MLSVEFPDEHTVEVLKDRYVIVFNKNVVVKLFLERTIGC